MFGVLWRIKQSKINAIFLLLFGTIIIVDQVSSHFRNRLTHGRAYKDKGAIL